MSEAGLVAHVVGTVQRAKSQTDVGLTQCLPALLDALQAGESVALQGLGRFHLHHRPLQAGRKPRMGETIPIPAKTLPTFL